MRNSLTYEKFSYPYYANHLRFFYFFIFSRKTNSPFPQNIRTLKLKLTCRFYFLLNFLGNQTKDK